MNHHDYRWKTRTTTQLYLWQTIVIKFAKYMALHAITAVSDRITWYRDVPKVFGHCNFLLYISYKTTIFENIIPKSILVRFWWNFYQQKRVFCDYFKIFFGSTDFKCSWFKHKLKLFVFKCTIIVLYFWRSKFSFVFKSWTHKNYRL